MRKALVLLEAVAVVVVVGLLPLNTVVAQTPSADRSFSVASVPVGGDLDVTVTPHGYGRFGQVVETLPNGFSYASSTLSDVGVAIESQEAVFTLLEDETFTYTVTATGMNGIASFFGVLKDWDKAEYRVGGDHRITVTTVGDLLTRYDTDGDGGISRAEFLAAADDYFDDIIDNPTLLEVADLYFDS